MIKRIIGLAFIVLLFSATNILASNQFTDTSGHWASGPIQRLVDEGIASGYPDGTFKPNGTVTVAEFIAFTIKTNKGNNPQGAPTKDGDPWYQGVVNTAIAKGVVKQGEFSNYNRPITRAEIARMLVRNLGEQPSTGNTPFHDDAKIPSELKGYVKKAVELGLISGNPDGTFKPNSNATRGESSAMLVRMIDPSERRTGELNIPEQQPPKQQPPKQQNSDFIEPEIEVVYNDNPASYWYFEIRLNNRDEYPDYYKYKIEFENPLLNQYEIEGLPSLGVTKRNQWFYIYEIGKGSKLIESITRINNTLIKDKDKFKMYDGMKINFTVHIKNTKTGEERTYPGSGTIHKIDFYYYGSPF